MNRKMNLLLMALIMGTTATMAQAEWIDITESYVMNPTYLNNDYSYWEGTPLGSASPKENAEHYEKNYNTYQQLHGLPRGHYRVSLSAFYRAGDSGNDWNLFNSGNYEDSQYAQLYATSSIDDYFTPIALASSAALSQSLGGATSTVGSWGGWGGWWGGGGGEDAKYIPNNMEAAYYWFQAGYYLNTVECDVAEDGELTIGIRKTQTIGGDWTCIDDWKLEFYGVKTLIESLELEQTKVEMVLGETYQLKPIILPENATYRKLNWTSSDEEVVTVDQNGNLKAIEGGTAIITAETTDGTNLTVTCEVKVTKHDATASSLIINEIMSANVDMYLDPAFYYGGFVELYNPSETSASIAHFYVSDDPNNLKKCRLRADAGAVSAKGFLVLWFGNRSRYAPYQVDMELDTDGGMIYISNSDGELVTSQGYPPAIARTSYARKTDNGPEWGYTGDPTPWATNSTSKFAVERLEAPVVDQDGQVFSGTLQVCVNIPAGTTLRYTTNGSTPTLKNGSTSETGLFTVDKTTNYRFRLFKTGKLPSAVVTRTYIQDNNYTLPIISVVGNYEDIYGSDHGVLARGNGNGIVGNGQSSPCNWNTDWEHPVNFEYLIDGKTVFNQEASIKSAGGWSRAYSPHSFKIKAGKVYEGKKFLDYPFFERKPHVRHKVLQMRNGGNDTSARIIDAAISQIMLRSGLDIDAQEYQPTQHFINGSYVGVINMREPNNKHYALANWNIDTDEMDQFEMSPDSGYVQKAGDKTAFLRWYELAERADDEEAYAEIRNLVDIDEYINYMACQIYLGGTDFPQNNVKAYRPRVENGRFRFVTFDLDFAFNTSDGFNNFFNKRIYTFDKLYDTTDAIAAGKTLSGGNRVVEEIELVTIFQNMLKNETFRKQFIDTFCIVSGSVFESKRSTDIVNELSNRVYDAMKMENMQSSLTSSANKVKNAITSSRENTETQRLLSYDSYFHLNGVERQEVKLSANIEEANLLINNLPVPTNKFSGHLFSPITLRASAPAGYKFTGWYDKNGVTNAEEVFPWGTEWSYYDQGSLDDVDWINSPSEDWNVGNAPLGYYNSERDEERNYQTTLDYGSDNNNRYPTYYFAKKINLQEEPKKNDQFQLDYTIDDGFIIYINGEEGGRYNMPSGTVTYNTYATTYANNNPDSGSLIIDASLFHSGENIIAVEVHNNAGNSTDIYWDAALYQLVASTGGAIVSTDETYTMPSKGNQNLVATYEPLTEEELAETDAHPVKVNEISASNSIFINEYFKREDWIELYNTTDQPIDLDGMYLSDNLKKPTKFKIEKATDEDQTYTTVIPPHGHLIIWADKQRSQSQLHASFKLAAEGGDILLTAADESWCDTLSYIPHNGDQTVGLYPDGGSQLFVMSPTIEKSNRLNSYAELFDEPKTEDSQLVDIRNLQLSSNGGMSLAYLADALVIHSDDTDNMQVTIYTPSGATVLATCTLVQGSARVGLSPLPAGIYIAHVRNSEGDYCQIKFIKK